MATVPVPQLSPTSLIPPIPVSSLTVHPPPSNNSPGSAPNPPPSSVPFSDPPPPPPPLPLPSSSPASGDPPASSVLLPPPTFSSDLAPPATAPIIGAPHQAPAPRSGGPLPSVANPLPSIQPPSGHPSAPLLHLQRPVSSSDPKGSASQPQQLSYAQAARSSRGPSFVRSHASEVESFAKIPRTGVNIICGSREGLPSFSFVSSDLPKVEEIYSNALVMKFSGGRPSLEASHREILSWGMEKPFSIGPLTSRAFLLRFLDGKDLLKVLTRPSSLLITFPYKVFRWHNLCHISEDSCLAPVWISLPRLPLQCFVPEFLEAVGNKIGKFLCFDRATTTLARPSAARICVELDLRKPAPQFIWVGLFDGFKQPVLYDRMPKFCAGCNRLGHSTLECSRSCTGNPPSLAENQSPNLQSHPPPVRRNAHRSAQSQGQSINSSAAPHQPNSSSTTHIPPAPSFHTANAPPSSDPGPSSGQPPIWTNPPQYPLPASNTASQSNPPQTLLPISSTSPQTSMQDCRIQLPTADNSHDLQLTDTQGVQSANPVVAPSNPPRKSILRKGRKKTKTVTFNLPGQSNLAANKNFWNAVNRQVALIEQRSPPAASAPASQCEEANQTSSDHMIQAQSELSSDESSGSSIAADSPTISPRAVRYASEGEDFPTEQSPMIGHNTDDLLNQMPVRSKRNKRHPDKPLNAQLRVRKDPTSSAL